MRPESITETLFGLCGVLVTKILPGNFSVAKNLQILGIRGKESNCQCILIPGSGRSSGEGNGNPLQYSCLENSTLAGYNLWVLSELDTTG